MKMKLMLGVLVLTAAVLAAQDTLKLERKYKEGDKDTYKIAMQMTFTGGTADISMKSTQTVKKVYENGEADIESATSDLAVNFGGQEMSPPAPAPTTLRFGKNGMPIRQKAPKSKGGMNMAFMSYVGGFGDKPMKVGETVPVDATDPENPKYKVSGTVKLESIDGGVAKFIANLDVKTEETGDKPMKIAMTSLIDSVSSKPNKVTGTVSNFTGPQGMQIDGIQFTMERLK